jgi:DNA-binding transcriptional MerR regulator/methylmalonyl-CoA mutase cobalamin-binding subunit
MENIVDTNDPKELAKHPIQVVSRRTGLSNDVIRVWERRYGVVEPERQETGRRLYSDADIRRLALLQRVTSAGRRISDVARLDNSELEQMADEDLQSEGVLPVGNPAARGVKSYVDEALQQILNVNPRELHRVLVSASSALPLLPFLEQVVAVLLDKVGNAWKEGGLRIGHEHVASAVIRRFLLNMLGREQNTGPLVLLGTPAGQRHEMGALMAAIVAESEGWRVLYLGPDLPAREIAAMASHSKASAIALSMQSPSDEALIQDEIRELLLALSDPVPLIVGGRAAIQHKKVFEELGVLTPTSLSEFEATLASL